MVQFIICLFILELFFGLNGKLLVLGGIPIRHWLFAVVIVVASVKALLCFVEKWKEKKAQQIPFRYHLKAELESFSRFDQILLCFLVLHGIWIVLLPCLQRNAHPEVLQTALSSGLAILVMALYFPAVYLLRNGKVKWEKYRRFVIGCFIAVAVWHIGLYILEKIQRNQDHTVYFMERFLAWWEQAVHGHCELPQIVMPKYAVRIIYGCNIFLLMSFYFIVGQRKKIYLLWALLEIAALLTTGTRSLIVGTAAGIAAFLLLGLLIHGWSRKTVMRTVGKAAFVLAATVLMDTVLFQGMNVTRLATSFSVSKEVLESGMAQELTWDNAEYSMANEVRGTINSNTTRLLQIKDLGNRFKEHPLFGHGFTLPGYDMQGVAYLVKVGLVGILLWGVFLGVLLHRVIRMERKEKGSALPAVYVVTAVIADVMLQCMFGSLTIAMAVFVFLDLEDKGRCTRTAIANLSHESGNTRP